MKISKIFHWLYFTVMMLPCVIIPIFAIYTRNENYNSNIEVQTYQNTIVDFNQYIQNGNFNNGTTGYYNVRSTVSLTDNILTVNGTSDNYYCEYTFSCVKEHVYIARISIDPNVNVSNTVRFYTYYDGLASYVVQPINENNMVQYQNRFVPSINSNNSLIRVISTNLTNAPSFEIANVQLFDLTQMFGLGKEPTNTEFENYFQSTYYDYITSELKIIDTVQETYNDTDVGSQFIYTLFNATDKYFNFDNFFGLDNVYSWIQLNWFSGNAPLGFAIFWHFFTYWLLASLAWLLFDLMVYVPLFIHRWLDKGAIE